VHVEPISPGAGVDGIIHPGWIIEPGAINECVSIDKGLQIAGGVAAEDGVVVEPIDINVFTVVDGTIGGDVPDVFGAVRGGDPRAFCAL
jgi:hypothetical protein